MEKIFKNKEFNPDIPLRRNIIDMDVNERMTFTASKLTSVKVMCSDLSFMLDRQYSTKINKKERNFTVTRLK